MEIDERFTKLHGVLELVETCREVIEHCHEDADETFTHPITDFMLSQQQEIERLKGDRWISVEDRLPESRTEILVYDNHKKIMSFAVCDICFELVLWETLHDNQINNFVVTHWQPLPKAPKEID